MPPIGPAREGTVATTLAKSLGCFDVAETISVICARRGVWMPSVRAPPVLGGSKSIHRNLSNFVRQCRSAKNYDGFPRRSNLALVVEEGIVKSGKRKPSYDASQTYEFRKTETPHLRSGSFGQKTFVSQRRSVKD